MVYDVIIIGLGAAGVSASIYAKRSGMNVLVINFGVPGGIISQSSIVENYPGFTSISGIDIAMKFYEHFNSLNIPLINDEVIDIKDGLEKVVITKNNEYKCKKVIICSGRKARKLNIENEDNFIGKGISYCSVCDGNLYKEKDVCVIGSGNSSLESSLYLSKICKKVYHLVKGERFIGDDKLIDDVMNSNNTAVLFNQNVKSLLIDNNKLVGLQTETDSINVECIFVHIGFVPSLDIIKSLNLTLSGNYIVVDSNMETSVKGIYACGDIIQKNLYQLVTAVSDGAIAATHSFKNLNK